MDSKPITNTENIINSRALFTRINWLKQQLNYHCLDEYSEELETLKSLARNVEEVASVSTYEPGADLVRDSYFEEYKKTLLVPDNGNARFKPVDFGGVIYWLRQ